ncbi:carboxypeptidase-like regulatory domain-containing protein [Rapidithrix thailandica]|uniref:Carboxypeptidase-like regulatory domain-containing protein n=1 Tax=Rapidithrix thailandica TaxID=413964 RepID=A0AAW9S4H0_9BACT
MSGSLSSKATQEPIAFANIGILGQSYGTISNLNGEFELKIHPEALEGDLNIKISCMGYESLLLPLKELKLTNTLSFQLQESVMELHTVPVYAKKYNARDLVKQAFLKVKDNYPVNPYLLNTFYRHYCKEEGQYGRLIEAAVDIYDPKGHRRLYKSPEKKVEVKVDQLRRSFDFTSFSELNHAPISIYSSLANDITSYKSKLRNAPKNYTYEVIDTTYFDKQMVFVVAFSKGKDFIRGKNELIQKDTVLHEGEMYIKASDFAFLKVVDRHTVEFVNEERKVVNEYTNTVTYKNYEDKYYLNQVLCEGTALFEAFDANRQLTDHKDHYYHIEMMTNNVQTRGFVPYTGQEPSQKALLEIAYDKAFWENYNILKATPLEEQIAEDLANRLPLDQQFALFNAQSVYKDSIETAQFQKMKEEHKGDVLLVSFWDSKDKNSLKALRQVKNVTQKYEGRNVYFVYLSIDRDEDDWQKARVKYLPSVGMQMHLALGMASQIIQKYNIHSPDNYLLFDHYGQPVRHFEQYPGSEELSKEINRLLLSSMAQQVMYQLPQSKK